MKVLIINNNTLHLEELKHWLSAYDCEVVNVGEDYILEEFDLVVLSGSHTDSVIGNESKYAKEIELVKSGKPVIGICLGCEIVGYAFGAKLEKLPHRERGMIDVNGTPQYESHCWVVKNLPPELELLATSKDGIEIIRHKSLPVVGLQFHPEVTGQPKAEEVVAIMKVWTTR